MFEPTVTPGPRRRPRRARLRLDVLRRPVGGRRSPIDQVVAVGKRLFDLGASQLCLGDTIGVGTAGHVDRAARARSTRPGSADDRLAMHFHDTYGQALANALRRAAARHHHVRRQSPAASAAARTPRAPPATSPPRTWSGCCTGLGIEHGVDLDALVATSGWMAGAARPARVPSRGRPRAGRRSGRLSGHELASSTCTSVRRRPARRTSRTGWRSTRPRSARHDVHYPLHAARRASSGPRSTCSSMPGAACRTTSTASGTAWSTGSAGAAAR